MSRDDAIRSTLCLIWKEVSADVPPAHKPAFFLTLYGILDDAVESAVRQQMGKRWILEVFYDVSLN